MMRYNYLSSPIGELLLAGEAALQIVGFPDGDKALRAHADWRHEPKAFAEARRQLTEYFSGKRKSFDVPIDLRGTPFQKAVLTALTDIPYGQTRTYKEIAEAIGKPKAVRAVGAANGANPLPLILPCHRVIGSNGKLTGFGGGLPVKEYLLALEGGQQAELALG